MPNRDRRGECLPSRGAREPEDDGMEDTIGTRIGDTVAAGVDAIADGIAEIGDALLLDELARQARSGAKAAGRAAHEGFREWHEAQPVTSTTVAGAVAATAALAAFAGKRGALMALTGSAFAGALLLPLLLAEWMGAGPRAPARGADR
jgi:hypothetical protein